MVILHYTAMTGLPEVLDRLCDPAHEVSAHYLIAPDGEVFALVPEEMRAWHAGASRWGDVVDVNSRSIGIELQNRGDHPFAARQMLALEALLAGIMGRWGIAADRVLAHSDVAPGRKIDPGARFDWQRLARQGMAVWPGESTGGKPGDFRDTATAFGYDPALPDDVILRAFRLRFRPGAIGALSDEDRAIMSALARRWPVRRD